MTTVFRNAYFLIFVTVSVCANAEKKLENRMNILKDKPVFSVSVENRGAIFEATINGVVINSDYDGSDFSVDLPVNQFLTSGKNTIDLYSILNIDNGRIVKDSSTIVTLKIRNKASNEDYNVASIVSSTKGYAINNPGLGSTSDVKLNSDRFFYPDDKGDVVIGKLSVLPMKNQINGLKYSMTIDMDIDIPRWRFLDGDSLTYVNDMTDQEYDSARKELVPIYQNIQKAILNGNIERIMPLFKERNTELDAAFYLDPGSMEKQLFNSLKKTSNDTGLEPADIEEEFLGFRNGYSGQLSHLVQGSNHPAISFNFKDAMGSLSYDIWFRKEGDKWIISR